MNGESEPTKEQLLAMAYADGELEESARKEFEQQLAARPDLAREVVQLNRLHVLARQMAGPEPMDYEWARLARDPFHRAGIGGGLLLLLIGAVGLTGWLGWEIGASDDLDPVVKLLLWALLGGGVLMLLASIRARLRTLPYDPYTEIQR